MHSILVQLFDFRATGFQSTLLTMQNVLVDKMSTVGASAVHHCRPMTCLTREAIGATSAVQCLPVGQVAAVGLKTVNSSARRPATVKSVPTSMENWMKSTMQT